eukprot:CAMPEP_0172411304 /NCGR_PEP_ID=MMETSP1061-20121228/77326_1 /TAXON_ID=37318 /ORGANISM="Pseudo-nitzschia pungens, Strain cf. pungens" /LENGTH=231 /DNA_ID=CAMNT_0013147513 /DNA_START=541 /DNA_END=1236 /DNA_ORIENTATION=+
MTTPWGKRKGVSFGNVTVREYNRSIGDWWDIPNGLGLGWEYVEHPSTQIEELTDEELAERARLKNLIRGVRYKISAYRLVLRYRCSSKGTIQVDKCSDESMGGETRSDRKRRERKLLARKKMRRQCLTWEDTNRTTSRLRESLLKNFGFTPEEMELSERERKLLRMEYTQWTQKARQQEGQKTPSKLFLERFVADIRHSLPRVRSCAAAAAAATGIECKSIANNSKISPEE